MISRMRNDDSACVCERLKPNISNKTHRDRGSLPNDHQQEIAHG